MKNLPRKPIERSAMGLMMQKKMEEAIIKKVEEK